MTCETLSKVHEMATAISINLENALAGDEPDVNFEMIAVTLDEIAELTA